MIAIDTNVLVYAHRKDSAWHEPARRVVRSLAEGRSSWAIPWPCLHEFFSVVTHPRIYDPPSRSARALDQIDAELQQKVIRSTIDGVVIEVHRRPGEYLSSSESKLATVVQLDKPANANVDVYVNQKLVARGEVVVAEENFGIRIKEIVAKSNP